MKHCLLIALAFATLSILSGCRREPENSTPSSWWTLAIRNAAGYGLEVVHDSTGWILGKATVNIEQIGESRNTNDGKLADFRITVTSSDESFTSEIKDLRCDELGIPNDDSQAKFDEAVEKIKKMLTKLQS